VLQGVSGGRRDAASGGPDRYKQPREMVEDAAAGAAMGTQRWYCRQSRVDFAAFLFNFCYFYVSQMLQPYLLFCTIDLHLRTFFFCYICPAILLQKYNFFAIMSPARSSSEIDFATVAHFICYNVSGNASARSPTRFATMLQ
jgi:hypothetical protein